MVEEIRARVSEFLRLTAEDDQKGVSEIFAEDAWYLAPRKDKLVGRQAILAQLISAAANPVFSLGPVETTEVQVLSDEFGMTGSEADLFVDGNKVGRTKVVMVWKKVAGVWYIYRDIFNTNIA